jgi:hypothetical protein
LLILKCLILEIMNGLLKDKTSVLIYVIKWAEWRLNGKHTIGDHNNKEPYNTF